MAKPKLKWSNLPENLRPIRIKPARKPNKKNLRMTYIEKSGEELNANGEMMYQMRKQLNLDDHIETGLDRGVDE